MRDPNVITSFCLLLWGS